MDRDFLNCLFTFIIGTGLIGLAFLAALYFIGDMFIVWVVGWLFVLKIWSLILGDYKP